MPEKKPQQVIAGDTFIWNSTDPEVGEVRIPLKFKTRLLREGRALLNDELEFMFYMLDGVLGSEAAKVDEMDAAEMKAMFYAWQVAWQERSEASFPESSGSST